MTEKSKENMLFKEFIKKLFHICWHAPKKTKMGLIICLCCLGISSIFSAIIPVVSGHLINSLKESISSQVILGILILWTICYVLIKHFSEWFENLVEIFQDVVFQKYNVLFRLEKLQSAFKMPATVASSDFKQKMVASIPRLGRVGENAIYNVIWYPFHLFGFASAYIILFFLAPVFSLIILAVALIQCFLMIKINTLLKTKSENLTSAEVANETLMQDALENLSNVQMLGISRQVIAEIQEKENNYFRIMQKYKVERVLYDLIPNFLTIISQFIVVYMSVRLAIEKQDMGLYVMLSGLGVTVLGKAQTVISHFKWLHMHSIDYMKLNKELTYDTTLTPKSGPGTIKGTGDIEMEKVSFTYPNEKEPVLSNLNLKIKAGSRVAIIGNSGMGKSTLINVMQHAFEVQAGTVKIDGKNLQKVKTESLRKVLTFIDQHPTFWNQKNIKENLLMFNPKATDVELMQALRSANLLEEITKKTKGIESKVTSLSAGQKQRLALARALLRKTPIIIMDEPTANLDTTAQKKVLDGIKNLSVQKGIKPTVIFASNVPAEIAYANRILLLENGQIVEDGNPKKLMTNPDSKVYQRLKKYKALFD